MKEIGGKKIEGIAISEELNDETKKEVKEEEDKIVDRNKFKKVDMPVFHGNDLDSWLFRADRYFQIHKLRDSEKMTVSVISFNGLALDWYRSQGERNKIQRLVGFKKKIVGTVPINLRRFVVWEIFCD